MTVQVQDSLGNLVPTDNSRSITMAIAANPGGGTLGGTTSVGTVNGVATFSDLYHRQGGTNYTLAASSAGLTGVTSSAFNINNPAPTISSISPDHACTGQILNVIVRGRASSAVCDDGQRQHVPEQHQHRDDGQQPDATHRDLYHRLDCQYRLAQFHDDERNSRRRYG